MDAITDISVEHQVSKKVICDAVEAMWRGVPFEELTYDMVESALYAYYEQMSNEEAEEALYP